jgi:hypothetical protein
VVLFAILIPVTTLFFLGVTDYMLTNALMMETVAAADLAAHTGAQNIQTLPDGRLEVTPSQAADLAAAYFAAQAPEEAVLEGVVCGEVEARPACRVSARLPSAGWLLPPRWIQVQAVGYLVAGVTEGDQ